MEAKFFDVDTGDREFTKVIAVNMAGANEAERYIIARSGYGTTIEEQACYTQLLEFSNPTSLHRNRYSWRDTSAMRLVREYIEKNFSTMPERAMIVHSVTGGVISINDARKKPLERATPIEVVGVKGLEIRDRMTAISGVAIRLQWTDDDGACLTLLGGAHNMALRFSPADWGDRTWNTVHVYISGHWNEIDPGDVLDVEHILGEVDKPKVSERLTEGSLP